MTTTTTGNNAASNSLINNTLTAATHWEIWQIERYGNTLIDIPSLVPYDEDDYQQNYVL